MKKLILSFATIVLFIGCLSERRVQKYVRENAAVAENITNEFIRLNKVKGAEICIEVFPPEKIKSDTILIVRDSTYIERAVDTLYQWFTDNHFIDKVKIRTVFKPFEKEKIVTNTVTDTRYKTLYESKIKDYDKLQNKFYKIRKGLILTWAWIILLCVGFYLYRRR